MADQSNLAALDRDDSADLNEHNRLVQLWSILTLTPVSTVVWLAMIAASVALIMWLGWSLLWLPVVAYGFLALHEVLAFTWFHRGFFPSSERVARVYQWFTLFLGDHADLQARGDLTEGLFSGDFSKSIEQATIDKYDAIIDLLGLKRGMRVLDVGCGLGDFLSHLRARGINGVGLTLSPDQRRIGISRGLDIKVHDFRGALPADLTGKFDAVTLIGSLEHFSTSYEMGNRSRADRVFARVFETAAAALKPDTSVGKIFSATLHSTAPQGWTVSDWIHAYSFHAHYSGLYPRVGDFERLCAPWFTIEHKRDTTIDYQYSSIVSSSHFGNFSVRWSLWKLFAAVLLLLVNPFAPWSWVYHARQSWMWQFGGKDLETDKVRPAQALWYVHRRAQTD